MESNIRISEGSLFFATILEVGSLLRFGGFLR